MFALLEASGASPGVAAAWDRLVDAYPGMPYGIGVMSRHALSMAAREIHAPTARVVSVIAGTLEDPNAILPCYVMPQNTGMVPWRKMGLLTDLYPTRTGILSDPAQPALASDVLAYGFRTIGAWDVFMINAVAGSPSDEALRDASRRACLPLVTMSEEFCPFIEFPDTWDDFLRTKPPKLRDNLRLQERKLRLHGTVSLRRSSAVEDIDAFVINMLEIERTSWKQDAGTAITRKPAEENMYRLLLPRCAAAGLLRSYLLVLDDAPIAFLLGLLHNGVFFSLKTSYDNRLRTVAPGIILRKLIMQELISEGIRYWDYVGPLDAQRQRWATGIYTRRTYAVFNQTTRGRLLHGRVCLGRARTTVVTLKATIAQWLHPLVARYATAGRKYEGRHGSQL